MLMFEGSNFIHKNLLELHFSLKFFEFFTYLFSDDKCKKVTWNHPINDIS